MGVRLEGEGDDRMLDRPYPGVGSLEVRFRLLLRADGVLGKLASVHPWAQPRRLTELTGPRLWLSHQALLLKNTLGDSPKRRL